ncbi:MAG: hypothetical protein KBH99_00720 [Syntrophobacteraceae bacterium]|nr:hypothetical protein [Syntrophobacteraceae bacterium]
MSDGSGLNDAELQTEVNILLKWGIIFGFGWLLGFGSLVAVFFGVRAFRIVWISGGLVHGTGKAVFCIILGILGLLPWVWRGYVAFPKLF